MDISVSQAQGSVPVTVLKLDGQLDGQNYQDLIVKAQELHREGTRDLLLDLSDLTYISSAGLVALHSIALLLKGEEMPDTEGGWSAYRSIGRSKEAGIQKHIKLLNPSPDVSGVFEMVGFNQVFEVFTDRDEALKSF